MPSAGTISRPTGARGAAGVALVAFSSLNTFMASALIPPATRGALSSTEAFLRVAHTASRGRSSWRGRDMLGRKAASFSSQSSSGMLGSLPRTSAIVISAGVSVCMALCVAFMLALHASVHSSSLNEPQNGTKVGSLVDGRSRRRLNSNDRTPRSTPYRRGHAVLFVCGGRGRKPHTRTPSSIRSQVIGAALCPRFSQAG